mmetsp:Transcript_7837/g.18229  ORF Transcript_7837/g.18229 Transcript_7837/m.18229 type:complete len:249 (-) Transcript_7837:3-749(-)
MGSSSFTRTFNPTNFVYFSETIIFRQCSSMRIGCSCWKLTAGTNTSQGSSGADCHKLMAINAFTRQTSLLIRLKLDAPCRHLSLRANLQRLALTHPCTPSLPRTRKIWMRTHCSQSTYSRWNSSKAMLRWPLQCKSRSSVKQRRQRRHSGGNNHFALDQRLRPHDRSRHQWTVGLGKQQETTIGAGSKRVLTEHYNSSTFSTKASSSSNKSRQAPKPTDILCVSSNRENQRRKKTVQYNSDATRATGK